MLQEMRDRRKEGNKTGPAEEDDNLEDSMLEEKRKYEEIMARLGKHKSHRNLESQDADQPVAISGLHDNMQRI
jgi:hypothetical protein